VIIVTFVGDRRGSVGRRPRCVRRAADGHGVFRSRAGPRRSPPTTARPRIVRRERRFHDSMVAVDQCSLVCLDPDHDRWPDDQSVSSLGKRPQKHTYLSEVGRPLKRDLSPRRSVSAAPGTGRVEDGRHPRSPRRGTHRGGAGSAGCDAIVHRDPTAPPPLRPYDLPRGTAAVARWGDEFRLYRWQRKAALV
jgi:hypothetical protein